MSIELLPADKVFPEEYHVRYNYCNCHPETCCCDPWAVFDKNGEMFDTFYRKEKALKVAELLNSQAEK